MKDFKLPALKHTGLSLGVNILSLRPNSQLVPSHCEFQGCIECCCGSVGIDDNIEKRSKEKNNPEVLEESYGQLGLNT